MLNQFIFLIQFLKRIGIAVLIYFVLRILFLLFNFSYFSDFQLNVFFYGLVFDAYSIAYLFLPFIIFHLLPINFRINKFYQIWLKLLYYFGIITSVLLNCIDLEYFKFTLRRSTSDFIDFILLSSDVASLIPHFIIDFWYISLIFFVLLIFVEFLYRKTNIENKSIKTNFLTQLIIFIITISLTVIIGRGGVKLRPISISHAGNYVESKFTPLVINTPFSIISTYGVSQLNKKNYYKNDTALNNIFNPIKSYENKNTFKKYNVVIIILESFSKEFLGYFNKNSHYTPFLDSIFNESLVFTNAFANGRKSIEALPSIISGLPTLMNNPYITSNYIGNETYSLPNILKKKGYNTSFFHGGKNGTMGFEDFTKIAGVDNYYGLNEYNNSKDYDGSWGIYDDSFLQFFLEKLNKTQQPFFSGIFTLSSHDPYNIPDKFKNKFSKGNLKIHESIGYTDYSLKLFFEKAKKTKWFKNTLFVFTADHTSAESEYGFYHNSVGAYMIPIAYYLPNSNLKGSNKKITQQIDIMPSVLNFLGYNDKFISYGNSVFQNNANGFSINYSNDCYNFYNDKYYLQFDGEKLIALYNYKNDSLLTANIFESESLTANEMLKKLKAIVQSYNNRMIDNSLIIR